MSQTLPYRQEQHGLRTDFHEHSVPIHNQRINHLAEVNRGAHVSPPMIGGEPLMYRALCGDRGKKWIERSMSPQALQSVQYRFSKRLQMYAVIRHLSIQETALHPSCMELLGNLFQQPLVPRQRDGLRTIDRGKTQP